MHRWIYLLFFFFCLLFRAKKKSKPLNLKIHSGLGSCENIASQQRSPLLSERSLRSFFVGHVPFLPSTPPVHTEANFSASKSLPHLWLHWLRVPMAPPSPALCPPSQVQTLFFRSPLQEHPLSATSHLYHSRSLDGFGGGVIGTGRLTDCCHWALVPALWSAGVKVKE